MPAMHFEPFGRPLDSLSVSDLAVLRHVAEGWYVEYKEEVPDLPKVAKSLCAFANHFGGWVFYGVRERLNDEGGHVAGEFPGVDADSLDRLQLRIRDAAVHRCNPDPYFEMKAVLGPCSELGLPPGRAILIVAVPEGRNPPYVHSSGRIYRRIADSSEPKAETDRLVLDVLSEKRLRIRERLLKYTELLPETSQGEGQRTFVHVHMLTEPGHDRSGADLSFEELAAVMRSSGPEWLGISMDNMFATTDGFVARHVANNDPLAVVMTYRYFWDGSTSITIPVNSFDVTDLRSGFAPALQKYEYRDKFCDAIGASAKGNPRVVDLNQLFGVLAAMEGKHMLVNQRIGYGGGHLVRVAVEGAWRRLPFLDMQAYIEFVKSYGCPVPQQDASSYPSAVSGLSFLRVPPGEASFDQSPEVRSEMERVFARSMHLFKAALCAFGIPDSLVDGQVEELLQALRRSLPEPPQT